MTLKQFGDVAIANALTLANQLEIENGSYRACNDRAIRCLISCIIDHLPERCDADGVVDRKCDRSIGCNIVTAGLLAWLAAYSAR